MNSQQQLHQLVNKEQELKQTWQEALAEVENNLRDYNDAKAEELNNLRSDENVLQAVADMVDKAKTDAQKINKNSQKDLQAKLKAMEETYNQRESVVLGDLVEDFKNKYRQ